MVATVFILTVSADCPYKQDQGAGLVLDLHPTVPAVVEMPLSLSSLIFDKRTKYTVCFCLALQIETKGDNMERRTKRRAQALPATSAGSDSSLQRREL